MNDVKAPKEKILTEEDYDIGLQKVRDIIKGKSISVIKPLQDQMKACVKKMEFEKAEILHQKLEFIQQYRASSMVVNTKMKDMDVFTIRINESQAFVNYLLVRKGAIVKTETVKFNRKPDDLEKDILIASINHLQKKLKSNVPELIVPFPIEQSNPMLTITVPKKGTKRKLLNLSNKNLKYFSDKAAQNSPM